MSWRFTSTWPPERIPALCVQRLSACFMVRRSKSSRWRCQRLSRTEREDRMANDNDFTKILYAQEQSEERLLDLPPVIGVASGPRIRRGRQTRELCVQVFVERKRPLEALGLAERVPETVAGIASEQVATDVIEIARPSEHQDVTRYRPVRGGCSIGPEASVSAGTLGGWACDNTDDTMILLTNNHVISGLDNLPAARRIVQPGRLDGGTLPADVIGSLKRHVALTTVANRPRDLRAAGADRRHGRAEARAHDPADEQRPSVFCQRHVQHQLPQRDAPGPSRQHVPDPLDR